MTTGLWLIGALGHVATLVAAGVGALRRGAPRTGLVTDGLGLDLPDPAAFDLGGHDVRAGTLREAAAEYAKINGVLSPEILEGMPAVDARPGIAWERGARAGPTVAAAIERVRRDFADFRARHAEACVVNVASAEPAGTSFATWREFEDAVRRDDRDAVTPSMAYAAAALLEGLPYVNFTSSTGSSLPAMEEIAVEKRIPHMGRDAKTGETLVKTALAPLFQARRLKVLAWESHNLLGNGDGWVLSKPEHAKAKLENKNAVTKALTNPEAHSGVRIDYVPSLGDWKTAWDFIHFEGFLGARMSMQFTWQGCDSALAAPLVLDLARLAIHAKRRGEAGAMKHAACFFKDPWGVEDHHFYRQHDALVAYARR